MKIKDAIPFDAGLFEYDILRILSTLTSPKQLKIKKINHGYANNFVLNHHYLHRKIYIARNVSYGLFAKIYCVGVCMYGFPVWTEYPGIVPPLISSECPELIRLCTISGLPKNTESFFVGKTIKALKNDWKKETGATPKCVTSLCDNALGFDGAIYKATNFKFFKKTKGRPSNPGKTHGKWKKNKSKQYAEKTMYVYWYK